MNRFIFILITNEFIYFNINCFIGSVDSAVHLVDHVELQVGVKETYIDAVTDTVFPPCFILSFHFLFTSPKFS